MVKFYTEYNFEQFECTYIIRMAFKITHSLVSMQMCKFRICEGCRNEGRYSAVS